jgi:hypothetical protein
MPIDRLAVGHQRHKLRRERSPTAGGARRCRRINEKPRDHIFKRRGKRKARRRICTYEQRSRPLDNSAKELIGRIHPIARAKIYDSVPPLSGLLQNGRFTYLQRKIRATSLFSLESYQLPLEPPNPTTLLSLPRCQR